MVQNGPGAAGTAFISMIKEVGVRDIIVVDECGIIHASRAEKRGARTSFGRDDQSTWRYGRPGRGDQGRRRVYRGERAGLLDGGAGRDHGPESHCLCLRESLARDHARCRPRCRCGGGGDSVVTVGKISDLARADRAIAEGEIDMVAAGRAFMADSQWVNKVYYGREGDVAPCLRCGACLPGAYGPVRYCKLHAHMPACTVNPR